MLISQLQRMRAGGLEDGTRLPTPRDPQGSSFGDTLKDAVSQVDGQQKSADSQIEAFVAGEQENVHEVMISMNQAKLSFQLMTEVRNKALETYHELMRMQV
ncbi:MAG: flagellar hook-basal body complex protein FliE [Bacteroidota bacterium]